jgi:hypothetical protein
MKLLITKIRLESNHKFLENYVDDNTLIVDHLVKIVT